MLEMYVCVCLPFLLAPESQVLLPQIKNSSRVINSWILLVSLNTELLETGVHSSGRQLISYYNQSITFLLTQCLLLT